MSRKTILKICMLQFLFISIGCREIYEPALENSDNILVIEALMTNVQEEYFVKLSLTSLFNSAESENPVSGATVWVADLTDNSIQYYTESKAGYYSFLPDAGSEGVVGHIYKLFITTRDGEKYESSPETLHAPVRVDSLYGLIKNRAVLTETTDDGSVLYQTQPYIDLVTDVRSNSSQPSKVRFKADWLFEMIDTHNDVFGPPPPPTYRWIFYRDSPICLSDATENQTKKEQFAGSLLVGYLRLLYSKFYLTYVVLSMNFYTLNEDSFIEYSTMKEQLDANNALFDPITTQIGGNISCTTNPEKAAIGLFEVSSHIRILYFVSQFGDNNPSIESARLPHILPSTDEGASEGIPPDWWIVE
jgi:hypothetical protein